MQYTVCEAAKLYAILNPNNNAIKQEHYLPHQIGYSIWLVFLRPTWLKSSWVATRVRTREFLTKNAYNKISIYQKLSLFRPEDQFACQKKFSLEKEKDTFYFRPPHIEEWYSHTSPPFKSWLHIFSCQTYIVLLTQKVDSMHTHNNIILLSASSKSWKSGYALQSWNSTNASSAFN